MFIFEWAADKVMEMIVDWIFESVMNFLSEFLGMMNGMGAELFDKTFAQAVVLFFNYFGWALFAVGLVVAVFECAIEYQGGRGSVKDTALNAVKGFMAVSLFTILPVELFKFCVTLQVSLSKGISGLANVESSISSGALNSLEDVRAMEVSVLVAIFLSVAVGYAVIKVFFANMKRGGILLIQIAVGSLYMFSVPRGYNDGFITWAKQVAGLCFTTFMQSVILVVGIGVMKDNTLLGIGVILAASEVPRIAQQFGMESGTKFNLMSSIYGMQSAISLTRTLKTAVTA